VDPGGSSGGPRGGLPPDGDVVRARPPGRGIRKTPTRLPPPCSTAPHRPNFGGNPGQDARLERAQGEGPTMNPPSSARVVVNFHGLGEPWDGIPADEAPFWCPADDWLALADVLAEEMRGGA